MGTTHLQAERAPARAWPEVSARLVALAVVLLGLLAVAGFWLDCY